MTTRETEEQVFLRDLGDGLVLRRATEADADALVDLNSKMHSDDGPEQPDEWIGAWTRDLAEKPHPTFRVGDFLVVEDTADRKLVSTMNLISQAWRYEGIPFGVGRPELVATLPEYRNRGLVRAQFEVIHRWSAERDQKLQAITGIPYYYRLFGYEMAVNLGGGRTGFVPHIPVLKEGEPEPYQIRPANEADLDFIAGLYEQASVSRNPLTCAWDETLLRYELSGKDPKNINCYALRLIEDSQGERVGFLAHPHRNWGPNLVVVVYELKPGVSWAAVTPSVIRYLQKTGESYAADSKKEPFSGFSFWLGEDHPVYQVISDRLPRVRKPYAWYIRIPDLPDFLRHIAPALEQRLVGSALPGHSAELKITFYRSGLRLVIEQGRLVTVEPWQPEPVGHAGDAGFPGLTFLQLLLGYRSLAEVKYAFPDCFTRTDEASALLEALFPRKPSYIWPVS
jgi:hypothetical protein